MSSKEFLFRIAIEDSESQNSKNLEYNSVMRADEWSDGVTPLHSLR